MILKPTDHPKTHHDKNIGVLLINLGTPENTETKSIRIYLKEFLSDRRVIDVPKILWWLILNLIILNTRPKKTAAAYKKIWLILLVSKFLFTWYLASCSPNNFFLKKILKLEKNEKLFDKKIWLKNDPDGSPLRKITRLQSEKLQKKINKKNVIVDYAMRYGSPSIKSKLSEFKEKGCDRIIILSLYPQYSGPTTATVNDEVCKWMLSQKWQPSIRIASPYFDTPEYINSISKSILNSFKKDGTPDLLLLSFHGAPKRYLIEGDPYHCQCAKTGRLIKEKLKIHDNKFMISFQSRFGSEPWLQPYTDETLEKLGNKNIKHLSVITPGFSADNIETLEEINMEGREEFLESGGKKFTYIPCLNDTKEGMDLLHKLALKELAGWI